MAIITPQKMKRNGQCRSLRASFLLTIFLLIQLAVCEEQSTEVSKAVDPDIASVRSFFDDVFGTYEGQSENALQSGRTFGHKRTQFMLMPMIYKMGVMMTMLAVLTVISLKGLLIGATLLILKLSTIIGKFFAHTQQHHGYGAGPWTPPQQPVHVHLHNNGAYEPHNQAYHGWEPPSPAGTPDESYYYKG